MKRKMFRDLQIGEVFSIKDAIIAEGCLPGRRLRFVKLSPTTARLDANEEVREFDPIKLVDLHDSLGRTA